MNCPRCGEDWSDVAVVRNATREASEEITRLNGLLMVYRPVYESIVAEAAKHPEWFAATPEADPTPTDDACGDDSWDTRYACVKAKGHPVTGPGLTDHDYRYKRSEADPTPTTEPE